MKAIVRSSTLVLVGLGLAVSPLASGCGSDDTQNTGGGTTTTATTTQGGGGTGGTGTTGTTSNGGSGGTTTSATGGAGGTGGTTSTGGGGEGGTTSTGGGGEGGTTSTGGGGTGGTGGGTTTTTSTTTTTTGSGGGLPVGDYDCTPAVGSPPALKRTTIATGLDKPAYVRAAPGDKERLFIIEQPGRIRILKNGVLNPEPFLDITDRVHPPGFGDERGLLGLAFHPDYQNNGRFFVYYTEEPGTPGDQILAEYARNPNNPDLATEQANGFGQEVKQLFKIDDLEGNHNGGMLEFGTNDGMLYIGTGDGGGADDEIFGNHAPFGNAQNLASMWGKILRVDVNGMEGGKNYAIPTGNLTAIPANNPSLSFLPEIWDFGLRNPWRFAFDPCNGDLFIGDVGQYNWEEIDIEPTGQGNRNYGWVYKEGNANKYPNLVGSNQVLTPPVDEYSHANNNCSITGGFVHRSAAIPGLRGRYFYGDYCSGKIWSFRWNGAAIEDKIDHTADLTAATELTSFGYDNDGNLYLTRASGQVQRIDAE